MKAIRLFLKHYALKSTRWRKFKYSIKHLIERKVFSSTKNNEWNIQKNGIILLVATLVLISTKEENIYTLQILRISN